VPKPSACTKYYPALTVIRIAVKSALLLLLLTLFSVQILRWVNPPVTSFMLYKKLHAMTQKQKQHTIRYTWVDAGSISPNLAWSVIAAEDQSFAKHRGFDFNSISKAVQHNKSQKRVRGASTISQQVAKNLFLWPQRSYVRKACEAYFTILIEVLWPKKRILEMYLNIVEFGDGIYGADAASRYFFHKPPAFLTLDEAALLSSVLPNPVRYKVLNPSEHIIRRQVWIMEQYGHIAGDYDLRRIILPSNKNCSLSPSRRMNVMTQTKTTHTGSCIFNFLTYIPQLESCSCA